MPTLNTTVRARTGAGFSADGNTMFMLVVDEVGGSTGVTVEPLGSYFADLGDVEFALNLDGGGSTNMRARGWGVVSDPSGGPERVVSNRLGVYIEGGVEGYHRSESGASITRSARACYDHVVRWFGGLLLIAGCSAGSTDGAVEDTDEPMVADASTSTSAGTTTPGDDDMETTEGPNSDSVTTGSTGDDDGSTGSGESGEPGPPRCQDGVVERGEQCDDGNDVNADGCNRDCRVSGQLIWQTTVGTGFGAVDQAFDVVPLADGSAVVGGYLSADDTGARDGWLALYGPGGDVQWELPLAGPGGGDDEIRAVASDGAGSLYAAGYTSGPEGQGLDAWVARYDIKGAQQWAETFNGPESMTDVYDTMTIDADGNLIVGGYSQSATTGNDVFLRKLDTDGVVLWSRVFPGPNGGSDLIWDVDVSPAGHVYAAGYEQGPAGEGRNAWLAKYDTDGNEIWSRSFNGPESLDDQLIGLTVIDEDDVVVSGYENGASFPWQAIVRRYDSLGMIVWTDRYPGATNEGAHGFGLTVDPDDGQLVMTGGEILGGIRHVLVRKYDAQGAERWTAVIPGGARGPDYGRELRVAADGEVWVTGAMDTGADARDVWVGRFTP